MAKRIRQQVQRATPTALPGQAELAMFTEPVLVISQKGKLIELRAEYAIHDRHGRQLGAVRGRRTSSRLTVVDLDGRVALELRSEASLLRSKVLVSDGNGARVGRIVSSLDPRHVTRSHRLEGSTNQAVGALHDEDRRRHREFVVQDNDGSVVAEVTKVRAGLAKGLLTKGDDYVVTFSGTVGEPLRSLSIAAALVIDSAYHQQK